MNLRTNLAKFLAAAMAAGYSAFGAFAARAALEDETGLNATGSAANIDNSTDIPSLIGGTISSIGGLVGAVFLALLVYGGIIWMTAQGNDEKIKKAKAVITSAVIGLIVTVASYSIASYVISIASNATQTGVTP